MTTTRVSLEKQIGGKIHDYVVATHKNPDFGNRVMAYFIDKTLLIALIFLSIALSLCMYLKLCITF